MYGFVFTGFTVCLYYIDALSNLTHDQYAKYFSVYGPNEIENASLDDLAAIIMTMFNIPLVACLAILHDEDSNFNENVNVNQYLKIMIKLNSINKSTLENYIELFKTLDSNSDGYINTIDLCESRQVKTINESLKLIKTFDINNDGKFNFIDFINYKNVTCRGTEITS